MSSDYWFLFLFLCSAMFLSVWAGKLTLPGALLGGLLGFLIYEAAGYTGLALMAVFFVLGTAATSWKKKVKERLALAEKNSGRRKLSQVFANAGVAGILSCLTLFFPQKAALLRLMMAASFSAATADTLSSELGIVYGRRFYNILTLKKEQRGWDGVVSAEGTFLGMGGSVIIAAVYALGFGWNADFLNIVIAGTAGNLFDSFLGATLERKNIIKNDSVNFLNTLFAALVALCFYYFFIGR